MTVTALNRTLDQELLALERRASLECLVCGEFVLHHDGVVSCPECGAKFGSRAGDVGLQLTSQAG